MQYLILTDMHGNAEALRAVLRRVRRKRFDATLVLGDLVGYGAGPNQVVDAIRALPGRVLHVRGNHDKVASGIEDGANFNNAALTAALWTKQHLGPTNLRFVRELPRGPIEVDGDFWICHGSPVDEDQYILSIFDAWESFSRFTGDLVFFGHTHIPSLFVAKGSDTKVALLRGPSGSVQLEPGSRYMINPGSIGQPRDRDPMAAYMTFDSEKRMVRWYRIAYPVARAQERIVKAGLPKVLADRLALGV